MWDLLSYDWDKDISPEKCLQIVLQNIQPGSIVVFHDYPDALVWVGIVLIVGAGIYIVYRESIRGRKELFSDPMPRNR